MKCPACLNPLLQIVEKKDGSALPEEKVKVKLRTPIMIFNGDGTKCVVLCAKCKQEIEVPIVLDKGAIQAARATRA